MKVYDFVQWSIVIGIVIASALYMLGRIAPQWRRRFAQRLQQPQYPQWLHRLGARMAGGSGCGSCDTCGSCAKPTAASKK